MKNRIIACTGLIALFGTTSFIGVFAQGTVPVTPPVGRPGHAKRERHPEIMKAIRELENAARTMRAANHDFAGHREAALDHTTKAIEELRMALKADRQ